MEDEEFYYLQPGFNANDLTMPVIRNLLLKHDINYPSGVKKAKLVEIFEQELAPKASKILAEAGRVKASARGIVNAEDYGTIGEPEVVPTPKKRASRRAKAGSANTDNETTGDEEAPMSVRRKSLRATTPRKRTASPTKRGRKSSAAPQPETTDDEEAIVVEATPKPKRGRRSLATKTPEPVKQPSPSPSPELPAPVPVYDEPAFSNENPFQMGSSPKYQPAADPNRRRTMLDKSTPRQADSSRRRTEGLPSIRKSPEITEFDRMSPLPKFSPTPTKMVSMSRFKSLTPERRIADLQAQIENDNRDMERDIFGRNEVYIKEEDQSNDMLEPGEEFTPDSQLEVELEDERANAVNRYARSKGRSEISTTLTSLLYTIIGIAIMGCAAWWREEKLSVGYCGVGKPSIKNANFPDWANNLVPQCEPCPPHAVCRERLSTDCYTDYVLVKHPFSFGGLLPLAPSCQPDSEKIRRVSVLSEAVLTKLRDRAADIECGYAKAASEEEEGLAEKDIKDALYNMKSPTLSDFQFTELWNNAVQDLESKDEVVTSMTSGGDRYFKSTNLSNVSWTCAARKNLLSILFRWRMEIASVFTILLIGLKVRSMIIQRQIYARQVQRLVTIVMKRLARQQRLYYNERATDIAYIPVNQLRDQILSKEFDTEKRKTLWAGVSKVIEMNANVRTTSIEHMGEIMRCWTWIGSATASLDNEVEEDVDKAEANEAELRSFMGAEDDRKELVKAREELTSRILY